MSSEDIRPSEHENQSDDGGDDNDGDSFLDGASPDPPETQLPNPPRSLTYVNGVAIMISLQIGAGIFSTPAAVRTNVSTSTTALLVWILAGILVWTGAAAFIEL